MPLTGASLRWRRRLALLAGRRGARTRAVAAEVVQATADRSSPVLRTRVSRNGRATQAGRRRSSYANVDFETLSEARAGPQLEQLHAGAAGGVQAQFKSHLSVTYGRQLENYRNEKVAVTGDREEARGDWTVKTKILRGGGADDILVDYRLRQTRRPVEDHRRRDRAA